MAYPTTQRETAVPGDVRGYYYGCHNGHRSCCGMWVVFHYAGWEGRLEMKGETSWRWLMIMWIYDLEGV